MSKTLKALMTAAAALPGLAQAATVADQTTLGIKYLDYLDYQKDRDRIRVRAPMAWLDTALDDKTELSGSMTYDSVSGASPWYLSTVSGASGKGISETRRAMDAKLTRLFEKFSLGLSGSVSTEHDYLSRSAGLDARVDSDDRNTTYAAGFAVTADDIGSTNNPFLKEERTTRDYFVGITQVLTPLAIVQSNLALSDGTGYFSDPYKPLDMRPRERRQLAWLTRYRQYLPQFDAALHADYRYFSNDWGIHAHTVELAWYQPVGAGWTLRPSLRYYTQNAADFFQPSFPPAIFGSLYSADQRLSAFGSLTTGIKVLKVLPGGYTFDAGFDFYQQKSSLKLGGGGSPGIEPLYAKIVYLGIGRSF